MKLKVLLSVLLTLFGLTQSFIFSTGRSRVSLLSVYRIKQLIRPHMVAFNIPIFIRLAFHDCMGGCDGCLNRNHPGNAGSWLKFIDKFDEFYDKNSFIKSKLSRADFYNLAAVVAIEEGIKKANEGITDPKKKMPEFKYKFRYGRMDCANSPISDEQQNLPDGKENYHPMYEQLQAEFGFTTAEYVAIMGAHTVGALSGASGYQGNFKGSKRRALQFNNEYYKMMLDKSLTWKQVEKSNVTKNSEERWQWEAYNSFNDWVGTLLNTDMNMAMDVKANDLGEASCDITSCERNKEAGPWIEIFAENQELWLHEFESAFKKIDENGYGDSLKYPSIF